MGKGISVAGRKEDIGGFLTILKGQIFEHITSIEFQQSFGVKKIVIAGGTGHLGSSLANRLIQEGHSVRMFTRKVPKNNSRILYSYWDGETPGPWIRDLDGSDVLINLCGKSVDCRYTEANKLKLIASRVKSTTLLGQAIGKCKKPPSLWINSSSSAYYGFSEKIVNEYCQPGDDFPATICVKWEHAFFSTQTPGTRKVAWRLGVVLQSGKGLIEPFVRLAKSGIGGKLGTGKQYFTWIHEKDFLNAAMWTINHPSVAGVYNLTSPEPVTNAVFMNALRGAVGVPLGISLPSWLIYLGGKIIGTEPYLVLDGRRVVPDRLLDSGFEFSFPGINHCLSDLFKSASV